MIKLLSNLPGNTVGIAASGQVSATDYETVLGPAVEAALEKHGKLRFLYQIGSDFSGFTPGAMWEDMKMGMAHLTAWERIAVVTDISWIANAASLFSFMVPCPVRVFALKDRAEAEAWVVA